MYEAFGHSFDPAPLYEESSCEGPSPFSAPRGNTSRIDRMLREWGYIEGGRGMAPEIVAQTLTEVPDNGLTGSEEGGYSALAALRAGGHRSRLHEVPSGDPWGDGSGEVPRDLLLDQEAYPPVRGRSRREQQRGRLLRGAKQRPEALQQGREPRHWTDVSEYRSSDDSVQLDGGLERAFRQGDRRDLARQSPSFFGPGGLGCEPLPGSEMYEDDEDPEILLD